MLKNKKTQKYFAATVLCLLVLLSAGHSVASGSASPVVQSYISNGNLQQGMIVRFLPTNRSEVETTTLDSVSQMIGVIVAPNQAALTLSNTNTNGQQVFVATSGRYLVLVSNQNGAISGGDYISISSLAGIGMKAAGSEGTIIGRAAAGFNGTSGVLGTAKLTDQKNHSVDLELGLIPVDIAVGANPLISQANGLVPGPLARAAQLVTDKPVSAERIYLGIVVLLAGTLAATSVLYSGVRNSMLAIGRNPLARSTITRNLIQVILTSLTIFIIGLLGLYLLLKL
ncbi:MAG TPA: hypothetical protein VNE40_02665 [Candidatus Dormibacteraeota bacterium]|nr:hypothetical protein [Candidatus Dormibacteraeota bacterium]